MLLGGMYTASAQQAADDSLLRVFFNDSAVDGHSRNDFAQSMEDAFQTLNGAQTEAALGWDVLKAKEQLMENRKVLRVLRRALKSYTNSGFRDLQLYSNMLEGIRESNENIGEVFGEAESRLENSRSRIRAITADSIIVQMVKASMADTSGRRNRMGKLKDEYAYTAQKIKTSLDSVHRWSSMVAFQSINTAEMIQKTDSLMQQASIRAFSGDCVHLWKATSDAAVVDTAANAFLVGSKDNNKIAKYYVQKNISRILWMPVLIFILFFRWVRRNYRRVRASGYDLANDLQLNYTRRSRVLLAVVASMSLFPLLDVHAPWFYLMLSQCIMMASVAYYFWDKPTRGILPVWFMLLALLLGISVANSFEPDLTQRLALLGLNLCSAGLGLFMLRRIKYVPQFHRTVRIITFLYIFLNLVAVLCNLFGRVIVAEALTNAGIVGLVQIVTLAVFVEAMMEALYLQLLASRIKRGIPPVFDYEPILSSTRRPMFIFILVIWGVMFMANLYMYGVLKAVSMAVLRYSVTLGSLSFTIGNMLLFFAIIWIAHLLQRYIGSFFGDADDDDLESKKQRSRMMVIKLVVICVGYLLAVAASGLPLDKITIVLGALGVGVGMGLQNIVNNFVSGVVLIFDRPLQIGDSIEVGENSGKVKSIGIRSSTLLTAEGAEVIIPNGDILSSPITNWTLSNNQRRLELEFTLQTSESKDTLIQLIRETLAKAPGVVTEREPAITLEAVKDNELGLKVFFWCNNIAKSEWIKSEARYLLYGAFREKGIVVV